MSSKRVRRFCAGLCLSLCLAVPVVFLPGCADKETASSAGSSLKASSETGPESASSAAASAANSAEASSSAAQHAVSSSAGAASAAPQSSRPQASAAAASSKGRDPIVATKGNGRQVEYIGRFKQLSGGEMRCSWSGSKAVAGFEGTGLAVSVKSSEADDYIEVRIDGKAGKTIALDQSRTRYVIAENLPAGYHCAEIIKRTEGGGSHLTFSGFDYMGGKAAPAKIYSRRIEVMGDSITAGYGNEGPNGWTGFKRSEENACKTYGMLAAEQVGAEASVVAWSGMGLAQDLGGNRKTLLPDLFYRTLGTSANADWTFRDFIPDVVVINIGTNDFQSGVNPDAYAAAYLSFIKSDVRKAYPNAYIICAMGPINHNASATIERVVSQLAKSGDKKVSALNFALQKSGEVWGTDGHPSAAMHARMAGELAEKIRDVTGW